MPEKTFGALLKELRERDDLTQEELGDASGFTHVAIGDWERGKRNPRRPNIEAVAKALGTNKTLSLKRRILNDLLAAAGYTSNDGDDGGDNDEANETIRIIDPDEVRMVKYLRGVPPELRQSAINAVESYKTAGDLLREQQEANTIGKRADRHEKPSIREKRSGDDAIGTDE